MELGDTVDLEGTDDGEVGHADLLGSALLDDGHATDTVHVAWEALGDLVEEVQVDPVDELEVAREEGLEERQRPLLECLESAWVMGLLTSGRTVWLVYAKVLVTVFHATS